MGSVDDDNHDDDAEYNRECGSRVARLLGSVLALGLLLVACCPWLKSEVTVCGTFYYSWIYTHHREFM